MRIHGVRIPAYINNAGNLKTKTRYSVNNQNNNKTKQVTSALPVEIISLSSINITNKPANIAFKRKLEEHRSWGAKIDPETKEVSFKIFTFPDAKEVSVKIFDRKNPDKSQLYPLLKMGGGVFQTGKKLSFDEARAGDRYSFVIKKADDSVIQVKDPYAYRQGNRTRANFVGSSILYDHSVFNWKNQDEWIINPERIVKNPDKNQRSTREASIYEIQIDAFTKEGTYEAAKDKIEKVKEAGFNTIEIMPSENTFSFNWGYDGVDKFAPQEHRGGPDKLKELIDYAHGLSLNVIIDFVPDHIGPDGVQIDMTGPYTADNNDFGLKFNFEGENSKYVRDYIVNAGINWLDNYKADGLRLDMTKYMDSDFTMKEIAAEIGYHFPDKIIIAEDSREHVNANDYSYWLDNNELHDKRITLPLGPDEILRGESEDKHCVFIEKIDKAIVEFNNECSNRHSLIRNLGYDSEWDFAYHHSLDNAIHSHGDGRETEYSQEAARIASDSLINAIYQAQNTIKYVASHDEIGNIDGTRPVIKYLVPKLGLKNHIILDEEDLRRAEDFARHKNTSFEIAKNVVLHQKMNLAVEKLSLMFAEGKLDTYKYNTYDAFYDDVLQNLGISKESNLTYNKFERCFEKSIDQHKMAQALTYAVPGPKLVFMGDENLELTSFRFFRQFMKPEYESYLKVEKGYEPGLAAFQASKLDNISYSDKAKDRMLGFKELTKDLNRINRENPALTKGYLTLNKDGLRTAVVHDDAIALHTRDEKSGNEIFVITNFKDNDYPSVAAEEYEMPFPEGKWVEILNTDDEKYGGSGEYINDDSVIEGFGTFDEAHKAPIKLKGCSTAYFKRIDF